VTAADGDAPPYRLRAFLLWSSIAVVAFDVRAAVILSTKSFRPVNDSADYVRLGLSLANGHGFGSTHFAPGGGPTALRPPLWPLALSSSFRVLGHDLMRARLFEAGLGALLAVLVSVLGAQLWGELVGAVAGMVVAVYPPLVLTSVSVMSEALFLPLEIGIVLAALAARRSGRVRWVVVAGVLVGLLVLTRPIGIVVLLPVILLVRGADLRRALRNAAIVTGLAMLVVLPWEIRDYHRLHTVVPVTTQVGYLLSGTYNATSAHDDRHPAEWRPPFLDPTLAAEIRTHPQANEMELGRLLRDDAYHYVGDHPGYVAEVVFRNGQRLLDLAGLDEERAVVHGEYGLGRTAADWSYATWFVLLALAAVGSVLRRTRSAPAAVWLVPALLFASTLPLQSFSRFRAPAEPFLALLAAVTLCAALDAVTARR
jgi:4-amino-4-deoxy-L-arabinose transferase-like glycosyltransferase